MSSPNDLRDLADRIQRLPGWRWMPGMWVRPIDPDHGDLPERIMYEDEAARMNARPGNVDEWRVDLTDPATAGCLLALLGPGIDVWLIDAEHAEATWLSGSDDPNDDSVAVKGCPGAALATIALCLRRWPGGVE